MHASLQLSVFSVTIETLGPSPPPVRFSYQRLDDALSDPRETASCSSASRSQFNDSM